MLYWRSKRIDTLIAHELEITTQITDGHVVQRDKAMILLLFFQQRGISASGSKPFLCQLSVQEGG